MQWGGGGGGGSGSPPLITNQILAAITTIASTLADATSAGVFTRTLQKKGKEAKGQL